MLVDHVLRHLLFVQRLTAAEVARLRLGLRLLGVALAFTPHTRTAITVVG